MPPASTEAVISIAAAANRSGDDLCGALTDRCGVVKIESTPFHIEWG
jgi:hypothetical protein